jgi:hypothetical protein
MSTERSHVADGQQLRLLPGGHGRDWGLDERTRRLGRQGIANARTVLRNARPVEPKGEPTRKAS